MVFYIVFFSKRKERGEHLEAAKHHLLSSENREPFSRHFLREVTKNMQAGPICIANE